MDSLGLGLTLDTTLLEKADKTLENMQKNSQLIMQNLTRGFTAFNEGKMGNFTQVFDDVSKAMDRLSKAKVSPDFDTKGQEKYIDRMEHLLTIVEKMSKIDNAKFFDPTEVYATDKRPDEIFAEMGELKEYKEKLQGLIEVVNNYGETQSNLSKQARKQKEDISKQENEVKKLVKTYEEAEAKFNSSMDALSKFRDDFFDSKRKKKPSLTDEEIQEMYSSSKSKTKTTLRKQLEEERVAINEAKKALDNAYKDLSKKRESLSKTTTKYKGNQEAKKNIENIKLAYDNIKEREKILQKELEFSKATEAERAAMLTRKNEAEIKADQKRIRDVQKSYETLRKEIQKGEKDIADLETSRESLSKAGKNTTSVDKQLGDLYDRLDKQMDLEEEFVKSNYPHIAELREKYETEAFVKAQKERAKREQEEQKKDVSYANQFSKNAKSVEEEKQAIELLRSARNNLSKDTAHYSQIVEALNKRILSHKDHIESVTREEKEQNTLADSVINRYRKQLKALDDVNEALEKQMKIERKTSIADLDPTNADTQALLARQKTIADDIADIESRAQGQLDTIREQHEAERSKKRIDETLRQNEREKQEYAKLLDDLYALEKQKKAMKDAGANVGDKAYYNILLQEADLKSRKYQLEEKHQTDLDEIQKKHNKKRNDDDVKAFIEAEKEKQKAALESLKKRVANEKKYGTISGATAERLISFTDNATNVAQHKKAIDSLQKARERLNNTDKDYLKTVKRLNEAIKYHEIEIELTDEKSKNLMQTHRGLMDIGGQLMRRLALVFSVSQLTQYFRKLVEVRGEFEKTEVALTTILKSRAQANVLMNQITDLAVKSPFTLQQLVGYTKQLAAYQIEYKKLYSTTKMLADVSSGLGVEMDRLILAFGQVKAANFLRATEVRQFTEAGFNILGELAKYYSELKGEMVSVGEVQEMVTKRMVGFADVEKVFQKVTSAGGIFYDMQAKQAETLAGQWSNLQDKISIMYNEIGKSTDGILKGIVGFLASLIDNWEGAATVLEGVVTAFAMVKINAVLANKETIKFVRSMGLIKGRVKAVKVIQLLGAAFVKLFRSIKAAGAALKAFAVNNPYPAAFIALASVIGIVISKHHKQAEAVKEVSKRYDELHESITDVNSAMLNAINEQDLEKQKDALKELVEMVDKEYNMKVNIDIDSLTPEEIAAKFNEIRDEAEKLNIFGALFGSGLEGFKASGMLTNDLLKDATQYGEAANELFKQMVDKSAMVASALQEIDAEKYKDIIKDLVTPRDIMGGESELTYLNRLYEAYSKIKEESNIDLTWDEDTDRYIARTSENFYVLGKILDEIDFKSLSLDYSNALKEFKDVEFIKYLDTLENSLKGLTDEQKEKKLKFAIDTEAARREWNAFVVQLMYEIANTKFGLSIKPEVEAPDVTKWEKWQENYKKRFEKEEGYMPITSTSITQEAQIKALNEEYKKQHDLLERIKNAGGESALEVGGAYEGLGKTMGEITAEMEDLNAQIEYLGGTNTTIDKNEEASQKILNRRISILKEIHEAYNQARKDDLGHEAAIQKVMKDWGDTFKEAFEGTSMSLTRLFVDKDKLSELQEAGKESGKVFSDAMLEEMNKMAEEGTYIREASEKFKEKLKDDEGLRLQLYDDKTGKVIKNATDWANKAGTATIGWGHAVTSLTEATKYFGKTITEAEAQSLFDADVASKQEDLNKVLDTYKELIVTQEQYDALLNRTFQGGGGMTKEAIKYATDTEGAIKHFEILDTKLQKHGMTFAEEFGEDFVENFKEAETVAERLALVLRTIGLTTQASGSQIDLDLYKGMKKRAEERAAEFTGDLEIVKLLEQASQTIADFDFATPEGLVKALRGLVPIAKKEGKEAMLALSKEISKVENEFGVKIRLENVQQFEDDIDKALLNYKSWKDLKKLSVPNDIAMSLFGVTPQSLEQVRKEVLEALNLGKDINLGNEQDVLTAVKLQYGEPTEKAVRDFLKNVAKMENDEQEERLKKYVEYAKKGLSERAKIKLEELKKLQEIEETFKVKEGDSADVKAQKEDMSKRASEKVRKESQDAMNKLEWEEFEKSDTFINIFDDIDNASTTLLNHMIGRLEEFKEQWKDMPLEDVNKIIEKLNLLQEKLAKAKPSEAAKKARDEIKAARGQIEMEGVEKIEFEDKEAKELAKKRGKRGFFTAMDEEQAYQDQQKAAAQEQISLLETALRIKEGTATASDKVLEEETKVKEMLKLSDDELKDQLKTQQGIVSNADKQNGKIQKARQNQKNLTSAQKAQYDAIKDSVDMANDLYSAFKELVEVLDADDPAMVFADMGMNILSSIPTMLTLIAQIHAATIAAEGLGMAMNMAMGIVGLIVMAIQLLVQAISAAVNYAEKMRQMKLDVLAGQVDNLKKKYDALAESIDKAYSTKQLQEYSKEIDKVQAKMEDAQRDYIKLLESGKDGDTIKIAKEAQRKLDAGLSVDSLSNKERKALLSEEYKDYKDATEALAEMQEDYEEQKQDLLDSMGGVTDYKSEAQEFVDAWVDAFQETGDGLSGLQENFREFFDNVIKQEAMRRVTDKYMEPFFDDLNAALESESSLSEEEIADLKAKADKVAPELSKVLEELWIALGGSKGEAGGLSALQKGISSASEESIQVLTAYWNSVRGYTASIDSKMDLILANMGVGSENNPMLDQLIAQTSVLNNIYSFLKSMTTSSPRSSQFSGLVWKSSM